MHLTESDPISVEIFIKFLIQECSKYSNLFILGDLFDYWIGDDSLHFESIYNHFKDLSKKTNIYFICGNRDFLVGESFFNATKINPLPDVSLIKKNNQKIILMHGDILCTDDKEYQDFRKLSRSNKWKENFLKKSLQDRMNVCNDLRSGSEKAKQNKLEHIMDVNQHAVKKFFTKYCFPPLLIHGHTHRPKAHKNIFNNYDCQRWVLGDWQKKANYLTLKDNGLSYCYLNS